MQQFSLRLHGGSSAWMMPPLAKSRLRNRATPLVTEQQHSGDQGVCAPLPCAASQARRTTQRSLQAGSAATGTLASTSAVFSHLSYLEAVFSGVTVVMVFLYALLCFAPKWRGTSRLLRPPHLLCALGLLYTATLSAAIQAGLAEPVLAIGRDITADPVHVPRMVESVAALFRSQLFTLLSWVHLLMLDFFMAREIWVDGLTHGVKTAHSVGLCFFVGPLGLLSHLLTRRATLGGKQRV